MSRAAKAASTDWWWCAQCKAKVIGKALPCGKCGAVKRSRAGAPKVAAPSVARDGCILCWAAAPSVLFLPCRHVPCCAECAPRILEQCPMCRAVITERMHVFVS